jgi:hypothetical protein
LPAIRYPVPPNQTLHNFIQVSQEGELRLTLDTRGTINLRDAENDLLALDYTPETLVNSLDLAMRLSPGDTLGRYNEFIERYPVYPMLTEYVSNLFFRFLPMRFTLILTGTP